jgi:hypothetical protein
MANEKNVRFKVRGIAVHPKTDRPYRWSETDNRSVFDPDGAFEISVAVPEDFAKKLRADMLKFGKEKGLKGAPKTPLKAQTDKETGENTGLVLVKAKQYGKDKTGNARSIAHYDGQARPLPAGFMLTSGSEVILDCYPTVYKAQGGGIKLNIGAIQVIHYVERQAFNPFEAVADGYDSAGDANTDTTNEEGEDAPFENEGDGEEGESTDF